MKVLGRRWERVDEGVTRGGCRFRVDMWIVEVVGKGDDVG